MKPSIKIYDTSMKLIAILENAFNVGYERNLNQLWIGSFSLPANDPKNEYCQPMNYVEVFDNGERVELFRILPITLQKTEYGVTNYEIEQVLATLIDDVIFQYHQIGGLGVYTRDAIEYVLSKQTTQRWVLGECDFNRQFQYKWENENLLGSLFSIPKTFDEKYIFTFDTTSYPWTLNLKRINVNAVPSSYIRYGVNQKSITRIIDPTELCTRLYGLGYGEGVNQLTISEINGGLPYIDSDTINQFGVIARILVDRRYEDPSSLKGRMETVINELKVPKITYEAQGTDLHSIGYAPYGKFEEGKIIRVIDDELKLDFKSIITKVSKPNITANPAEVTVTIANKPNDLPTSVAKLTERLRVNEVYAQGATNIDSYNFADNCDQDNPAVIKFYIPEETVRINKLLLSYEVSNFRAYSKAIEGGGALATSTNNGGGLETTTSSGGADLITSEEGGAKLETTRTSSLWNQFSIFIPDAVTTASDHTHGGTVPPDGSHGHAFTSDHRHEIDIPEHEHDVRIPDHNHDFKIPDHDHDFEIPSHIHEIEHGIFLAPILPSSVIVQVDGNVITGLGTNENTVDIIPYLEKDDSGKIIRGTWHTISITPNNLGRIVADVTSQFFVRSQGGGDY